MFTFGNNPIHTLNRSFFLYSKTFHILFFYENTKLLPSPGGIYALVSKTTVFSEFRIFPDLLAKNHFEVLDKGYKINFALPENVQNTLEKYDTCYHGTSIEVIESIVTDGLLKPGLLTVSGQVIVPPPEHIGRDVNTHGISNFADAIFLSPSLRYCLMPAYSIAFHNNQNRTWYLPVLECLVEKGKYRVLPYTCPEYVPKSNENPNEIEWRVEDPDAVKIKCLHLFEAMTAFFR